MEIVLNPEISKWRIGGSIVDEVLAKDLKTTGQLQNIVVRRLPDGRFELIGGQRRYLALKSIGKKPEEMDIKILDKVSDSEAVMMAYKENRLRRDLSDIEEGRAFQTMVRLPMLIEDIAVRAGRNVKYVESRLALLKLPTKIQQRIEEGKIPMSYGKALLMLEGEPEAQMRLAHKIAGNDYEVKTAEAAEAMARAFLEAIEQRKEVAKKYGPCPQCGSMDIGYDHYEYGEGKHKKLKCEHCTFTWDKDTKKPWKLVELEHEASKLGLELNVTDGKATLAPADMAKILKNQQDKLKALEKGNFRSTHLIGEILAPLVTDENLLRFRVEGDKIEIKLIENCGLHFSVRRHDYETGEKSQIKVQRNYWDEDNANDAERNTEAVRKFLLNLKRE